MGCCYHKTYIAMCILLKNHKEFFGQFVNNLNHNSEEFHFLIHIIWNSKTLHVCFVQIVWNIEYSADNIATLKRLFKNALNIPKNNIPKILRTKLTYILYKVVRFLQNFSKYLNTNAKDVIFKILYSFWSGIILMISKISAIWPKLNWLFHFVVD